MHVCSAANGTAAAASAVSRAAGELRIIPLVPPARQVQEFLEKSTREERQGLVVDGVPDAELFFVDKVRRVQLQVEQLASVFRRLGICAVARQRLWRALLLCNVCNASKPAAGGWLLLPC